MRRCLGECRVLESNVSGERLLELCSELELVIGNMYFRKKGINKLTCKGSIMEG